MFALRAVKVRLYPTPEQEVAFAKIAGCCRLVYNLGLEQRRDHWQRHRAVTGKSISWFSQKRELPLLKDEFGFLREVPADCLQNALANLQTAYDRFFKGVADYPKPRRRYENDSFTFPNPGQIRLAPPEGLLYLPKFNGSNRKDDTGPVRALFHRKIPGALRSVTISRSGTHWYAAILVRVKVKAPEPLPLDTSRITSLDRGVSVPAATAQGEMLGHIIETARMREREKRLRRALARCAPGSANRRKAKKALANHRAKMARRRADMLHQISSRLVKNHDVIAIETLAVRAMTASAKGTAEAPGSGVARKAGLNRAILDKGWGELRRQLAYKLAWRGGRLVEVPAAYSSQECARCHHTDAASRKGQIFLCAACGHVDHADTNAAQIIRYRALLQLGLVPAHAGSQAERQPAEGMVAAVPGELCAGISSNGKGTGCAAPGNEPEKAMT